MAVSAFYYDPEPQGGYVTPFPVVYYFDADSMTVLQSDDPLVVSFVGGGGSIQPRQTPPTPTLSEIDQAALNAALAADGSVVRALALVLLQEINTIRTRLSPPLAAYTQTQLIAALKAKMR